MEHPQYQVIQQYFQKSLQWRGDVPQFFILEWIQFLDETSILLEIIKKLLGEYMTSDFLWVRDFSQQLWKQHTIKIDTKTTATNYKELYDNYNYRDIGVRDVTNWLQQSSFSGKKVILLENIERMTSSALNAFLKTAEEPMEWKLIIATTKNKSLLLDTILSRALVFSISEQMSHEYLLEKMQKRTFFEQNSQLQELFLTLSLGILYRVEVFVKFFEENNEYLRLLENFSLAFSRTTPLYQKHTFLKALADSGLAEFFIDGTVAYYVAEWNWEVANKRLAVKKLLIGNVNTSQVLLYALVQLDN